MGSRIEELLNKYWAGESNLSEEDELKEYFRNNPSMSSEGRYFAALNTKKEVTSSIPFTKTNGSQTRTWLSIAASIVLGVSVALWVIQDAREQREFVVEDPQEAYEITRQALLMVSKSLNEGKAYTTELNKINKAEDIIKEKEN
jgi:hypothetical protein